MASVDFTGRLRALLSTVDAAADLGRYFDDELDGVTPAFTGSRFEHLDGGGDRAGIADVVTAADLVAVQMLSVQVPPRTAIALLEGHLAQELSVLLRAIPADIDMADAEPALLVPGSPADRAWHLLEEQKGLGWVTTC